MNPHPRWRRLLLPGAALLVAAGAPLGFALLRPRVEAHVRQRLLREAQERGLSLTLGGVHLSPWLHLDLDQVQLEEPRRMHVQAESVRLWPRLTLAGLSGRAARVGLRRTRVELPAGVRAEILPSTWLVESTRRELRLARVAPSGRLELAVARGGNEAILSAVADGARLADVVRVLYRGCPVADFGTVSGTARVTRSADGELSVKLEARAISFALAAWAASGEPRCADGEMGSPTDAVLELDARWLPRPGSLQASRWRVVAGGVQAHGRLAIEGIALQPTVELELEVPRLDFAPLLAAAALDQRAEDLGSAELSLRVRGPLFDPAALIVTQHLDFTPPARPLRAIERLRGPFVHRVEPARGRPVSLLVSPDSPDFIALDEAPPLFVRALLIAEDANFWGHPGVDLSELPVAFATNLSRGRLARGGSTIPQQLAKNLFLSRRRTLSRKLEEASLALLLVSALGRARSLEIYLNVIEWGPGLHGLRPAARHYFAKEPAELSPKQMAFLVSLIPGPRKYQRSFAEGVPTPFLDGLMTNLLTKLLSVGALSPEEYAAALAAPLELRLAPAGPQ